MYTLAKNAKLLYKTRYQKSRARAALDSLLKAALSNYHIAQTLTRIYTTKVQSHGNSAPFLYVSTWTSANNSIARTPEKQFSVYREKTRRAQRGRKHANYTFARNVIHIIMICEVRG